MLLIFLRGSSRLNDLQTLEVKDKRLVPLVWPVCFFFMLLSILLFLSPLLLAAHPAKAKVCRVKPLMGGQDDGPNILKAFSECARNGKVVLDKYYVVDTLLMTTGLKNVEIELSGTIQYTPNIAKWSPQSYYMTYQNATTYWFLSGKGVHLYGGGTLDANAQIWWDYPNKTAGTAGGSSTVFARPIPLTVGNASNVLVEDLTLINSPFWNNFVYQSDHVTYRNINVSAHSYSASKTANSDGWDIYRSSFVTIEDSFVDTTDDCVSFKPNTTDTIVRNMVCNGSHGISVGSLGQYANTTDIVENIFVSNISMSNASNGARIKVFGGNPDPLSSAGGGTGYVKNVTYSDFRVTNVDNPIFITQCYNTPVATCARFPSKLSISDIHFINVRGSSSGSEGTRVVDVVCSQTCNNITAEGTELVSPKGPATYHCEKVASVHELDFPCADTEVGV